MQGKCSIGIKPGVVEAGKQGSRIARFQMAEVSSGQSRSGQSSGGQGRCSRSSGQQKRSRSAAEAQQKQKRAGIKSRITERPLSCSAHAALATESGRQKKKTCTMNQTAIR